MGHAPSSVYKQFCEAEHETSQEGQPNPVFLPQPETDPRRPPIPSQFTSLPTKASNSCNQSQSTEAYGGHGTDKQGSLGTYPRGTCTPSYRSMEFDPGPAEGYYCHECTWGSRIYTMILWSFGQILSHATSERPHNHFAYCID